MKQADTGANVQSPGIDENMPMLNVERRRYILSTLHRQGKVLVQELSAALNVSIDTIRRDLRELGEAGELQRVHGGALPALSTSTKFAVRLQDASAAKVAIGKAAAQMIRNGQVVILDGGTTTLQIAMNLPYSLRATIFTTALPIASALAEYENLDVFVVGGQLFRSAPVMVGPAAVKELQAVRADLCFLGVRSLHSEHGASVAFREESDVKRTMVSSAAEVVVLCTAEKLGTVSPYIVAPINELSSLVTEHSVSPEMLGPYRAQGLNVIQV
jgi:DeoR/GlpR family transcriptional regulator of sugar metabolism